MLLKSDPSRALGFVAKLGDFGLVKLVRGSKQYVVNRSGTGTVRGGGALRVLGRAFGTLGWLPRLVFDLET